MISKQQLIGSFREEARILKHLASKISESNLDYRPSEPQRSTIELLRYVVGCGIVPIRCMLSGDWSDAQDQLAKAGDFELKDFDAAMDRQTQQIEEAIEGLSEGDFASKQVAMPVGPTHVLGDALLNFPLKFLAAYRMQLFLYLKASGQPELNTFNVWMGMDKPE